MPGIFFCSERMTVNNSQFTIHNSQLTFLTILTFLTFLHCDPKSTVNCQLSTVNFQFSVFSFQLLKHYHTSPNHSRNSWCTDVFYQVGIGVVFKDSSFDFAVPAEIFTVREEYNLTPSVIDIHLKVVVVNLFQIAFWYAEYIVQAVTIGRESVGQMDLVFAWLDGIFAVDDTLSLWCCDEIGAWFKDCDDGRSFSCAPDFVTCFGNEFITFSY